MGAASGKSGITQIVPEFKRLFWQFSNVP